MFVLKEMLPSYHKWRYNSHGVREQIGKENMAARMGGSLDTFLSWDKAHHTRSHHSYVFSGVQVA